MEAEMSELEKFRKEVNERFNKIDARLDIFNDKYESLIRTNERLKMSAERSKEDGIKNSNQHTEFYSLIKLLSENYTKLNESHLQNKEIVLDLKKANENQDGFTKELETGIYTNKDEITRINTQNRVVIAVFFFIFALIEAFQFLK